MEPQSDQPPLVVIVGETASGKTALALEMAQRFSGEIIAADSRTVYRGMDIGTAKPTIEERQAVPHHLLDIATPDQLFTVADFQRSAKAAILEIANRGGVPFLVGGSGLYVDAVLYDFEFRGPANEEKRKQLQGLPVERLQEMIIAEGLSMPKNSRNPRHLVRTLETAGTQGKRKPLCPNTLIMGVTLPLKELRERITARVDQMLRNGLEREAQQLVDTYGWERGALKSIGYREWGDYFSGTKDIIQTRSDIIQATMVLAKRQRTWFRRNPDIHWISKKEEGVDIITTFLNKGSIAKP